MKSTSFIKSLFYFSKEQRIGILVLFFVIVILQITFCVTDFNKPHQVSLEEKQWILLGKKSKAISNSNSAPNYKVYPFNPNFISDEKAYRYGMTLEQIKRLRNFRNQGKFANSVKEFQMVTGISDSVLNAMAPHFKFPEWVTNPSSNYIKSKWKEFPKKETLKVLDINLATKVDLMKVVGIGDAISDRIIKQKDLLGGFVSMDQMSEIWGLSPEVIYDLNKYFVIKSNPNIKKININSASIKELGQFYFFRYPISKNIVSYRSMNGDIKIEDLTNIKGFPLDKIKIIALYLEF